MRPLVVIQQFWVSFVAFHLCLSLQAELPRARLDTVFPLGARRGTEVEVSLTGIDLDEASQVLVFAPGVTAVITNVPTFPSQDHVVCRITVLSNVPPGHYDVRVHGRFGVSTARTFVVSDLPEVSEVLRHHTRKEAMGLTVPCIVNGTADVGLIDFYRFTAKTGQKFTIDCAARTLDSRLEPGLILTDMEGNEVARGRQGARLQFTARSDADYILQLQDSQFRGSAEFGYRLEVSFAPRFDFVLPLAFNFNTNNAPMDLFGYNIPNPTLMTNQWFLGQQVEQGVLSSNSPRYRLAPSLQNISEAFADSVDLWPNGGNVGSDPVRVVESVSTNILREIEPNDRIENAQTVSVPCEVSGQFYPARDRDGFQFSAKKGDVYFIEVVSQRLGVPTAPHLVTQRVTKNDKGELKATDLKESADQEANYGGVEFNTSTRDTVQRFEAPEDGTYRVVVRNRFDFGEPQPRLVYHLIIRKPQPDFRLLAWALPSIQTKPDSRNVGPWTAFVRRNESIPIRVVAQRRDGFNEPIHIEPIGLPPGVSFIPTFIPPDANSTTLYLTTASEVKSGAMTIKLQGQSGERKHSAQVAMTLWEVADYNNDAINSRLTRDGLVLGVSDREQSPVTVFPAERKVYEVAKGGKITLPIKIERHGEFTGLLKFRALVDPVKDFEVPANATNATLELDLSQTKLAQGTNKVELFVQVSGRYQRFGPEAIKASEGEVKSAQTSLEEASKLAAEAVSKEKENPEAAAKAKDLTAKKEAAGKRVEDFKQRTQPKDVTASCFAEPFLVWVK